MGLYYITKPGPKLDWAADIGSGLSLIYQKT